MRPEGREPLPDKAGESTLPSRSGGERGLRGGGAGKLQGSSRGRPGFRGTLSKYLIEHDGTFADHSYIQFNNANTGSSTVIDISNCVGDIIVDTVGQILQDEDGNIYYGRFSGTAMSINPFGDVIEIPET